jgi:dodecin
MSTVNVSELVGSSNMNWVDAVNNAVLAASQDGEILGVEVSNFTANVENGRIKEYKANIVLASRVH